MQLLQTGASIENVLVSAYDALIPTRLYSGATANPILRSWAVSFRDQHADHARACNEIASRLGGEAQTNLNATLAQVLSRARASLSDPVSGFDLLIELEAVSAQTYQNAVGLLGDLNARRLAASIMSVESQHAAAFQVARSLGVANAIDLIAMEPGAADRLDPATARAAYPEAFAPTDQARPAGDGARR